jgi:DNA modification methylase
MMESIGIFRADCTDFLQGIPAGSVHAVITDPPYGLDGMDDGWSPSSLEERTAKAGVVGGLPVGMAFNPGQGRRLQSFLQPIFALCLAALVPGAFLVAFAQPRLSPWMAMAADGGGFEVRDIVAWGHGGGQGKAFTLSHFVRRMPIPAEEQDAIIASMGGRRTPQLRPEIESILVAQKPRDGTFLENWRKWRTGLVRVDFNERTQQGSVFRFPKARDGVRHPSVKPVPLMERLIEVFTLPGQTVLDPFLGSGSTAVAAARTGRRFLGCDIDEGYVRLARERVEEALADFNTNEEIHDADSGQNHEGLFPVSGQGPHGARLGDGLGHA